MRKLIFFTTIILLVASCKPGEIVIINNGISNYEIVIPDNADTITQGAGNELSHYLNRISGADISLVKESSLNTGKNHFFIGFLPTVELTNPNTVSYKSQEQDLYITGGSPKSTLYAVYAFLEQELDCMWLSPEAEVVPQQNKVTIPADLNYTYSPEIGTRTVHSKLFYENHIFADKLKVTYEAFPGYVPEARVHTFHRFMPEGVFFEDHPEYYALSGEKRRSTQLCLSNPDVLKIVIDSVRAYFERNPGSDILSVSTNDNTQYCQCEECSAIDKEEGSASGTMIRFVNSVAEQFPDKTISTLAYQYTRKPCITKPAKNVLITLCSIECDRSKPIEEGCTDFATDLKGWKELTENIRIWDYTTQFTNFLAPFPNIKTLEANIRFFRDNNATWVFEQHSHNPSELFELRSYLMARLLWNPDLNTEDLIHEFCNAYYEEGGKYIESYIDAIHEEIKKAPDFFLFLYGDPSQGFSSFLRPEMLKHYDNLFLSAKDAVAGKPEISKRVDIARLSIHYAVLEASRKGFSEEYYLDSESEARLNIFEKICDEAGITAMNEMRFTVGEYIESYKKAINRSKMENIAACKKVELLSKAKKYSGEDPQTLTDKSLGGNSFYSNWLGFEGNDMECIIDLGEICEINSLNTSFLQVTNHIVFFPSSLKISFSADNISYTELAFKETNKPLGPGSKINDIEYYNIKFPPVQARYVKLFADNMKKAPDWHNASGLPAWIFCDEIIIN